MNQLVLVLIDVDSEDKVAEAILYPSFKARLVYSSHNSGDMKSGISYTLGLSKTTRNFG
jgi:hypothetical protein